MQIDDGDDEVSRAYVAISQKLQSWTSPNLDAAASASSAVEYSQDSVQWMKTFANDGSSMTPQKRSSGAATPIMSNAAKKQALSPLEDVSPWIDRSLPTRSSTESHEYRRYHDILYTYLAARRSLSERLRLTEQETALVPTAVDDFPELAHEERRIELDYLSSLATLEDALEGNVWSLLATLRSLGIYALLWQAEDRISDFLQQLASRTDATPGQLLSDLYHSPISPLILQRRKHVLGWMEQCHEQNLVDMELPRKLASMWPATLDRLEQGANDPTKVTSLDPDAPLLVTDSSSPLYGKDGEHEEALMKACLVYIRAGRMDDAIMVCQRQGQPWRCASWGGGQPYDIKLVPDPESQQVVALQVGNRRRALWKRTCWALARSPRLSDSESAIYAILSNDVQTALKNPALRSWEGGMYACWSAMLGRLEDDVLHRHNISKKISQEEEQLQATASIASWNEASILNCLAASPFEDMRPTDALHGAMASFLVGKNAVLNYVLHEGTEVDSRDLEQLRFLAHLLLYLDSLSAGTTVTTLPGVDIVKNRVVLQYLQQLGLRPDLWHMLALYASLLPTDTLIQEYPPILCKVEADDERASMCKQMRELLPSGMDLVVLRRVVRLLLKEKDPHGPLRSISWLCNFDEHLGDALVCTNMLLRNFLSARDDQVSRALSFIDQYLPKRVVEFVNSSTDSSEDEGMENGFALSLIRDSKLEFGALQCYLEAYRAFMNWKEVMKNTSPATATSKIVQNRAALNRVELDIANSAERRELVQEKRKASRKIVEAADAARNKLLQVLTYPGGWLMEEDSIRQRNDDEYRQRCRELEDLQARYLPRAVFFYHSVCSETATWMADSLDDAVPVLGKKALFTLDSASEQSSSPLSPRYWIHHAMSLAETVAAEENGICDTFSDDDAKHFVSLMGESEVRELQYRMN